MIFICAKFSSRFVALEIATCLKQKKSSPSASNSFICSDSQDARTINNMLAFLQDKYCSFSSYMSGWADLRD